MLLRSRKSVPNFAQIGQETWTLPEEIYNFEVKYGCW
jgi:hypothetical protein